MHKERERHRDKRKLARLWLKNAHERTFATLKDYIVQRRKVKVKWGKEAVDQSVRQARRVYELELKL